MAADEEKGWAHFEHIVVKPNKKVLVYGSWNQFREPITLKCQKYRSFSLFSIDVELPVGDYTYRFEVLDDRKHAVRRFKGAEKYHTISVRFLFWYSSGLDWKFDMQQQNILPIVYQMLTGRDYYQYVGSRRDYTIPKPPSIWDNREPYRYQFSYNLYREKSWLEGGPMGLQD